MVHCITTPRLAHAGGCYYRGSKLATPPGGRWVRSEATCQALWSATETLLGAIDENAAAAACGYAATGVGPESKVSALPARVTRIYSTVGNSGLRMRRGAGLGSISRECVRDGKDPDSESSSSDDGRSRPFDDTPAASDSGISASGATVPPAPVVTSMETQQMVQRLAVAEALRERVAHLCRACYSGDDDAVARAHERMRARHQVAAKRDQPEDGLESDDDDDDDDDEENLSSGGVDGHRWGASSLFTGGAGLVTSGGVRAGCGARDLPAGSGLLRSGFAARAYDSQVAALLERASADLRRWSARLGVAERRLAWRGDDAVG